MYGVPRNGSLTLPNLVSYPQTPPDFAVACYSGYLKVKDKDQIRPDLVIPADTPPVFLAHASDDRES
jgi:hypothetical protein